MQESGGIRTGDPEYVVGPANTMFTFVRNDWSDDLSRFNTPEALSASAAQGIG